MVVLGAQERFGAFRMWECSRLPGIDQCGGENPSPPGGGGGYGRNTGEINPQIPNPPRSVIAQYGHFTSLCILNFPTAG